MKTSMKLILAAGIGLGGLGSIPLSASAMPKSGFDPALAAGGDTAKSVENIRWICGPYGGCRWVPGWRRYGWGRGYGYWGPRRHWGPYGAYGWGAYRHRYYW